MSILDPVFREGLRAKRTQPRDRESKGVTDRDILSSGAHRDDVGNIDGTDEPGQVPVPDDPDANVDPDDSATSDPSPPALWAMPCSWWVHLVADPPETLVSPTDAETCLRLVSARLKATDGPRARHDARQARLGPGKGGGQRK
jgi:hypothetical protein